MILILPLLFACGTDPTDTPINWCEGATAHRYDPENSVELEQWPDDLWTVADSDSPTGIHVSVADSTWALNLNEVYATVIPHLESISGFHTQGRIMLTFTEALDVVPSGSVESLETEAIQLFDLSTSPATRIPYETELDDEGRILLVQPLRPLQLGTEHALVVTTDLVAADGGCISPSERLRGLLDGSESDPLVSRYAALMDATSLEPEQFSAATVWTTHLDNEGVLDAASVAREASYAWSERSGCVDEGSWRECESTFEAMDFRAPEGHVADGESEGSWELVVRTLLPNDDEGPYPVIFYGHGLNSSREGSSLIMSQLLGQGVAVVSVDALHHGDHPTSDGSMSALPFLGIDLESVTLDALSLLGSFEQTNLDRLQLLELLVQDPDIDGDGIDDLDPSQMSYVGISLGGMLGSGLLATSDRLQTGVLWVGGGHLINFAIDGSDMDVYRPLLESFAGGAVGLTRLLPVAQTLVDAADPGLWGAHVLTDRPFGGEAPDVLLPVALEDETVPPACGHSLARALDLPHLKPIAADVDTLVQVAGPLSDNHSSGATVAYFQYDRVTDGDDVAQADHGNTPSSLEGEVQLEEWIQAWLDTGSAVAIDPYEVLGTPQL